MMFVGVSSIEFNFLKAVFKKFGGSLSLVARALFILRVSFPQSSVYKKSALFAQECLKRHYDLLSYNATTVLQTNSTLKKKYCGLLVASSWI